MLDLPEGLNLKGFTLIMPSVSVGNVGQLTVDLLISTLGMRRVGRLFNIFFIPLVGANPYDETSDDLGTSVDIYIDEEKKIVVLQIRAPLVLKPLGFFNVVQNLVTDREIAKVIILTSSSGHEMLDEQIRTLPFRYLATHNIKADCGQQFQDLSWMELEPRLLNDLSTQTVFKISGGGFAMKLFDQLKKNNIECILVLKFSSEGDNIPDAVELINFFNQWIKLVPVDDKNACILRFPPSWKCLFGNLPPREIY